MHFLRSLLQPSLLRFLTFILSAIVLVPFDTPKTALAIGRPVRPGPPGADRRFPTPLICDYPNDDAIRLVFTAPGFDETVVFADLDVPGDGQVAEYCALYDRKWIYDCFPTDYLVQGLRSRRWLIDFYYRFNVIYLQGARGWVYLLSRADGPREELAECSFWFRVQFTTLRMNPNVLVIAVVNVLNYNDWWIYWRRGDGDQPRRRPTPSGDDDGNGGGGNQRGNGNGNGNSGSTNALGGIVSTGLTNLGTDAVGLGAAAWRAFWGNGEDPTAPAGDDSKDRKDQTDPGIKTDVLNLKIGELPDLPIGIDEKSTIAGSDPTLVIDSTLAADNFKPNDETSRVNGDLNIDESLENPTTATSGRLFGRRHRVIHSRTDVPFCNGQSWFDDPSIAADIVSFEAIQKRPETPASKLGLAYNFVPGPLATILITQYKKEYDSQQESVGYHLDITVLDPASKVLFGEKRIYAPSGQDITVNANLNYPLYVKVDDKNENPISFRYGNPLLSFVLRAQWDSNDQSQDHRCVTDPQGPWEDERQIKCEFKY